MLTNRRSLLKSLGLLSAAPLHALPASAASIKSPSLRTIAKRSLVVIFQGPWLFSPSSKNPALLVATTLGTNTHAGEFGNWNGTDVYDPTKPQQQPGQNMPHPIAAGATLSGTEVTPNLGTGNSFTTIFTELAAASPYPILTPQSGTTLKIDPETASLRQVTLPMPDYAYAAGQLKNSSLSHSLPSLPNLPSPYSVTVFEYVADKGDRGISFGTISGKPVSISSNQDTIFTVHRQPYIPHDPNMAQHIMDTFTSLVSLVKIVDSNGKETPLDLQLKVTDDCLDIGPNTGGLSPAELGFGPLNVCGEMKMMSTLPSNCAGGGFALGG